MNEKRLRYLREYNKKRKANLKAKGICVNCTVKPASKPHVCCEKCLEKKRINSMEKKIPKNIYESMINDQNGVCCICKKEVVKMVIDHDHETGDLRGLLCNKCNIGLGFFDDNTESLKNAIKYLKKYSI